MDAIEILGGLLGGGSRPPQSGQSQGNASSGGGFGGRVLEELLKAGMGRSAAPTQAPTRQPSRGGSVSHRPVDVQSEVGRLEDLLGVAKEGRRGARAESQPQSQSARGGQSFPSGPAARGGQVAPGGQRDLGGQRDMGGQFGQGGATRVPYGQSSEGRGSQYGQGDPFGSGAGQGGQFGQGSVSQRATPPSSPSMTKPPSTGGQVSAQDEALVLVRAMINAAKADGKLDQQEQQAILSRVPNDDETIAFLRQEFAQPLDLREYVWSVPLGLEVQVYTMSVATIQVDNRLEVQYLQELAHGLRLDPELCNQIHAKIGVQPIF